MAVDPGGDTALDDPQSWNKYTYAKNNPIVYVDLDGKEASPQNRGDWLSWQYNPIAATVGLILTSDATSETRQAFGIHGAIPDNTNANQVQHATMACKMGCSALIGKDIAANILVFHEWFDPVATEEEKQFDLSSNTVGFRLADDPKNCSSCINAAIDALAAGLFPTAPAVPNSPVKTQDQQEPPKQQGANKQNGCTAWCSPAAKAEKLWYEQRFSE
jgi:hypothetical protein